jgi:type IV pilus assembly protein PilA
LIKVINEDRKEADMSGKKGFTLVELLVVIIIVGILSAIAVPMMRANVDKAKKSEAVAALGAIRTAERLYFTENNKYVTVANTAWDTGSLKNYINASDLIGRYFPAGCYSVSATDTTFTAKCDTTVSGKAESNTLGEVNINEGGNIQGY